MCSILSFLAELEKLVHEDQTDLIVLCLEAKILSCPIPDELIEFALKKKNYKIVKLLAEHNDEIAKQKIIICASPNILQTNSKNETLIHYAFKNNHERYARKLLTNVIEAEVYPDIVDKNGLSLFHILCTTEHSSYADNFLRNMYSHFDIAKQVTYRNIVERDTLQFPVNHHHLQMVQTLLNHGAMVRYRHVYMACGYIDELIIDRLVEGGSQDEYFEKLVKLMDNRVKIIDLLLQVYNSHLEAGNHNYCDIINLVTHDEQTLLDPNKILDVNNDYKEQWLNYLLTRDDETRDKISNLLRETQFKILKLLLKGINMQESSLRTLALLGHPYQNAIKQAMDVLFSVEEIDANAANEDFETPLHLAVANNNYEFARILLNSYGWPKRVNINAQDCLGNTPLHYACMVNLQIWERYRFLKLLLDSGADFCINNNEGISAFSMILEVVARKPDYNLQEVANFYVSNVDFMCGIDDGIFRPRNCTDAAAYLVPFWVNLVKVAAANISGFVHYVNDKFLTFNSMILNANEFTEGFNQFLHSCRVEMQVMMGLRVCRYFTLYDLLVKDINVVAKYAENNNLLKLLDSLRGGESGKNNEKIRLPIYENILKARFLQGLARYELMKLASDNLHSITLLQHLSLNPPCLNNILSYFSEKELGLFNKAVSQLIRKQT